MLEIFISNKFYRIQYILYQKLAHIICYISMDPVCCGCHREVSKENAKNILNDDLIIGSSDYVDSVGLTISSKIMKLHDGIELLTGYKVTKTQDSACLCTPCYEKVKSFMIFRMELLASFEKLPKHSDSGNISKSVPDSEPLQYFEHQKNIMTVLDNYKLLEPKVTVDDGNADDNNTSLELNNSLNDESETNDSLGSNKLSNDQENNNLNDSDNSNEVQDVNNSKEVFAKVQDNDIESEVDFYSGEDDEVLELDIRNRKDYIVDSVSSSESETEVCDYEPIGKKIKNYNALSPAVLF